MREYKERGMRRMRENEEKVRSGNTRMRRRGSKEMRGGEVGNGSKGKLREKILRK